MQYSLPPDKLQRAIEYAHAGYWLHFSSELYAILILAAIVATGLSAKFRDWAEAASKRRIVQALIFIPLLLLTNDLLYLPANLYGQHLERKFDQSIQSWPSWFWDWTKSELILLVCSVPLAWLLYAVIRRSPRRWWLYFWLATLPIIVTVMYLEPMVIEPLFYRFEPLAARPSRAGGPTRKAGRPRRAGHSARPHVRNEGQRKAEFAERLRQRLRRIKARRGLGHDAPETHHARDSVRFRPRDGALCPGPYSQFPVLALGAGAGAAVCRLTHGSLDDRAVGQQWRIRDTADWASYLFCC